MEFLIIIALILLNGVLSMSEMALVSSRRFKLEHKKKGNSKAQTALELAEHPTVFLSTIQIGITVIGVFLGMYTNENLRDDFAGNLAQIGWLAPYAHNLATAIILISVTYFSIVLGELLPKRIGMAFPESITVALAKPMKLFSQIASPVVWLLSASNDMLLRMLGISNKSTESAASEEEIKSIIKDSAEEGEIQDIEQDIVERVFELGDRKAKTLYTHRSEIKFLDIQDNWETILTKISEEKHSAYPVCEENNIDKVVGMISLKDLFIGYTKSDFDLKNHIRTPLFLNESTYAYKIMELFREKKVHHGIVVDEYGSTEGIITMDDVVDALIGDISEESQDEYAVVQRNEHSWLVDGQYSIIEFLKQFAIAIEPSDEYTTVAGMLMQREHTMPQVGSRFQFGKYELEVVDKDGQRIDKIMVTETEKDEE